jgi:hypothetical protein
MHTDPSGACPLCISGALGALTGALVGGVTYTVTNWDNFSWNGLAEAGGKGALIGGAAGLLMPAAGVEVAGLLGLEGGAATATSIGVNTAVGMGYTWLVNSVQCRPTTPVDLLLGAFGGGASAALGPLLGRWRSLRQDQGLVEGANGALRDPATGRFAPNPDRVAPAASPDASRSSLKIV